jgi:hypothetical protein
VGLGRLGIKINYLSVVAAALAFFAIALPWLTVGSSSDWVTPPITMEFTAYLFQVAGTVNGIHQTVMPNVWFLWGALVMVLASAVACLSGTLLAGRKGQVLVLVSGLMALLSLVVFGAGLLNSDFVVTDLEPGYIMRLFPPNAFGITAEAAMEYGYDYSWFLGVGFWMALGSSVVAFISTVLHPTFPRKNAEKTQA